MKHSSHRPITWMHRFFQAQMLATLLSLPLLIFQGIPLCIMAPVGNLLFTPFLTLFLILSSLIFFTQLLSLPNALLISGLSSLCRTWEAFLQMGSKTWLISFVHISSIFLILLPLFTLQKINAVTRSPHSERKLTGYLTVCVMISLLTCKIIGSFYAPCLQQQEKPWQGLTIFHSSKNKLVIIDNGCFSHYKNSMNFISFHLRPHLIKTYGTTKGITLYLLHPCAESFGATTELLKHCTLNKVVLPFFKTPLSRFGWAQFFALRSLLAEQKIPFLRPSNNYTVVSCISEAKKELTE